MTMTMTMDERIKKWSKRLVANHDDLDEIDRLIGEYNSKYFGSSDEALKVPATHRILSTLADNVTKAATFHANRGRKNLWNVAKRYSQISKAHDRSAKQLENGVQDSLF